MKTTKRISQSELESYLWGAATLLRGYIDAGDYKQFIFPLLFYKRLCDVYDEEMTDALEESGGDQEYAALPEQHRFQIPESAHWKATRTKVKNVGKAIQDALLSIETANPDPVRGLRRCPVDQQGAPAGPHAARADRAFQLADAFALQLPGG